jgi:RNA-binding protein YhbY
MIQFKSLRQYTNVVNGIRFPNVSKNNYVLTYFSENSSLLDDYPKLNFQLIDIKYNIVPVTIVPRTRLKLSLLKAFKNYGLISYSSLQNPPEGKNVFYDLSQYLNALDTTYHPTNYRQRLQVFIQNSIEKSFERFPNFHKILIYSVDLTKSEPLNSFVDRKVFPLIIQLKQGSFPYDHLILCLLTTSGPRYRLLVKDKSYKFEKVFIYLKNIRIDGFEEDPDMGGGEETDEVVDQVMNQLSGNIKTSNHENVKDAVRSYIHKDRTTLDKLLDKTVTPSGMKKIGTAAILYKVSNNITKAKKITNLTSKKKLKMY